MELASGEDAAVHVCDSIGNVNNAAVATCTILLTIDGLDVLRNMTLGTARNLRKWTYL